MKVLFLGFSVLTGALNDILAATSIAGLEVRAMALAGHHFNHLYPWVDRILAGEDRPDVVLFDLASTPCRPWATEAALRGNVQAMLHRLAEAGIRAGFVHLYREDCVPDQDPVIACLNRIARARNLPVCDLASFSAALPEPTRRGFYFDGVHATPAGAAVLAARLVAAATDFFDPAVGQIRGDAAGAEPVRAHGLVQASELARGKADLPRRLHSRDGVEVEVLQIAAGQSVKFVPPPRTQITALYAVRGPKAGTLLVSSGETLEVYDRWCYYERLHYFPLPGAKPGQPIVVTQTPDLPQIRLEKGQPDTGPRIGELGPFVLRRLPG